MLSPVDLATLRLCSVLASATFIVIFLALWRGRRDQLHHLHWAASLILYCVTLAGLDWIKRPDDLVVRAVLLAVLTASNIPVATGVRFVAGRPLWRWWMAIPPIVTMAGFFTPHWFAAVRIFLPLRSEELLALPGLIMGMAAFGIDIMRQSDRAVSQGYGGRIAGLAMTAYIPCYLYCAAGELMHFASLETLARITLLSDQLLVMLLYLGLLAMTAEAALMAVRESASRDGLTGLYNRAWLASKEVEFLKPDTWLAHIDVDHFKLINDRFGHATGDATLIGLAKALLSAAHSNELGVAGHVVRMGGDEFLVIMPGTSLFQAKCLAQGMKDRISDIQEFDWTVSIGLAAIKSSDLSLSQAIERADRRLYTAKIDGRDRIAA